MLQWMTGCKINSRSSCWVYFLICINTIVPISMYKELQSCQIFCYPESVNTKLENLIIARVGYSPSFHTL